MRGYTAEETVTASKLASAAVRALGTVHALVISTDDFATFVDAHPPVLDIVEGQLQRRRSLNGEMCTILLTDVVGFGALDRTDADRQIIRQKSREMTQASLDSVWDECIWEDRGDGLLIVAPPHIPTAKIMTFLHRDLPGKLREHNRIHNVPVRIRLRIAANVGPVMTDTAGLSGEAIIRVARLIEAPVFKKTMTAKGAGLGIIVSDFVYDAVLKHAVEWINASEYEPVNAKVKESSLRGWMQLIDPPPPDRLLRAARVVRR